MITLLSKYNIDLLPKPNEYHLALDDGLPPFELITAALGLIFDGDRFLMTRLKERGWDIPGGHVSPGETPEEAVRREIYEEAAVHVGKLHVLGYDKFVIHGPKPANYRYPHPESYQVFFWGNVLSLDSFAASDEAIERRLFTPAEVRQTEWGILNSALYEAALTIATSSGFA